MRKIFNFFKKYSWIWIIIVVIIAIIGDVVLTQNKRSTPPPTPIAKRASFKDITPGISSEADLNKVLGTPIRTNIQGDQKVDEYKSTSQFRNHIAVIQNGAVSLIKEMISATDTTKANLITNIYGQAPYILYEKFPNSTFRLYVYPANGIAYLGHEDGTLQEIWYFVPTTIENFQITWASEYLFSPPTEQLQ